MKRRSLFAFSTLALRAASPTARLDRAAAFRQTALSRLTSTPEAAQSANSDETNIAGYAACFSKGLPHTRLATPDPSAYRQYLAAMDAGTLEAVEAIPMGGAARFACPLGAHTFDYTGLDTCQFALPPAPPLASAAHAADIAEVYWHSLTRDVPFAEFDEHPLTRAASASLHRMSAYQDRTPKLPGPAISQFLWQTIPFGATPLPQRWQSFRPQADFLTSYEDYFAVANGSTRVAAPQWQEQNRYIITPRDLAAYVWKDFSYQAFLNAALILLSWGPAAVAKNNPYLITRAQAGFVNYGSPMVLDFVARAANAALRATWFQKWNVHRRLRPEETAARLHTGALGLHPDLAKSEVLSAVNDRFGNVLLPMAFPEGCPLHPAYPAGHAAIAGACVTVLKALFNPAAMVPSPVIPDGAGQSLTPWVDAPLTIGDELDKLAINIATGRDIAGVHYRTDGIYGIQLGEQVAREMLLDLLPSLPEGVA